MPNNTPIELNKKWVYTHLCDVTDATKEKMAWVLLQEPGFIGFGVVMENDICFPPGVEPDWTLTSDLRLFGEKGEWHVWRDWEGKHQCRLLEFSKKGEWHIWLGPDGKQQSCPEKSGKKINILTEHHALWGNDVAPETSPWIKVIEDRGTEIWLPLAEFDLKAKPDLPLRLRIKQVIDYDPKYHLAGIVDAALVALVNKSKKILKPPPSLLPKTSQAAEEVPCPENTESANNTFGS